MGDLIAAELCALADKIERWANIDRGNITPTEADAELLGLYPEDIPSFEPDWIARDEYYARCADASLLRSRAKQLQGESE